MKKAFLIAVGCLAYLWLAANTYIDTSKENWTYGMMHQWRAHSAYSEVNEVVATKHKVYALSTHSLFSVDKVSEEIAYHNRQTGLNASTIEHIYHNAVLDELLICYQNGQIDIIDSEDNIYNIPDLYLKQTNHSKQINDIHMYQSKAFLAMPFGIICLNFFVPICNVHMPYINAKINVNNTGVTPNNNIENSVININTDTVFVGLFNVQLISLLYFLLLVITACCLLFVSNKKPGTHNAENPNGRLKIIFHVGILKSCIRRNLAYRLEK